MPTTTLDLLVDALESDDALGPQLVHRAFLPGQPSSYAEPDPPLPAPLAEALRARGVERLWSHQVEAMDAARRCEDVLITTPTASGKSLVFQAPVLEAALGSRDQGAAPERALFLFPLKALGQDQKGKLDELARACGLGDAVIRREWCEIYDGDTPRKLRERIRARPPRVLISNPDMLHYGILGNVGNWGSFLGSLRWVVLDELHTYRGVFGTHFHHVLQRLLRVARRHGADPRIVASSATAENADDFARRLTGRRFVRVDRSGAAREGRHFLLYQPATSPYTTAMQLFTRLVDQGLKTIMFTKARRITELLQSWIGKRHPELRGRIANYRAGFLAEERRDIEQRLLTGKLDGVISTSALEMGIDIGGLDACVLVGYPGSMMATWQRSGRVGRSERESVTALVALPDALDQYLLRKPDEFLNRACEPLIVRTGIESIGRAHLLCAAAELPLSKSHDRTYLEQHAPVVGSLLQEFALARSEDGEELYCTKGSPHRDIGLRGGGATYEVVSSVTGRTIGTVDATRVQRECHPGAIYLHAGRQYLVTELDPTRRRAVAEPVKVDYFTSPLTEKHTEVLEVLGERSSWATPERMADPDSGSTLESEPSEDSEKGARPSSETADPAASPLRAWLGSVRVTERVVGFERKKIFGQERLGQEELDLPPIEFETVALWFAAPRPLEETLREHDEDFMGALHAAEHAAISLFPVLALCDRGDLGGISIPFHPQVQCGAVFIYDGHAGGVGIAESGFERLAELLDRVGELLAGCDCEDGCPACIHSPKCGNGNRPLDKSGAQRLVRLLRGREAPHALAGGRVPSSILPLEAIPAEHRPSRSPADAMSEAGVFRWTGEEGLVTDEVAAGRSRPRGDLFDLESPLPEEKEGKRMPGSERGAAAGSSPASTTPARDARGSGRRRRRGRRTARLSERFPRRPLPREVATTVLFDVETRRSAAEVGGWHQLHRLGVALAVTCSMEEGRFTVYREDELERLVSELEAADLVIGFNVFRFDYPVLSGYTGVDYRRTLPTLDLFEQVRDVVGARLGLSHLTSATLGAEKSASGLESLEWYRQGRFDLIEDYCRRDVELLRDLYLFGRREGYVLYRPDERRRKRRRSSRSESASEAEAESSSATQAELEIGAPLDGPRESSRDSSRGTSRDSSPDSSPDNEAGDPEPAHGTEEESVSSRALRIPVDW